MNKKHFYLLIISVLFVSNLTILALLVQKPRGGFDPDGPKNTIIEKLQFDPQQVDAYQRLIDQHRKDIHYNDSIILQLKNELYALLTTNYENQIVDSLTTQIGHIQKEIETIHFEHFLDIKALCRPEQMPEYEKLAQELANIFNHKKRPKKD